MPTTRSMSSKEEKEQSFKTPKKARSMSLQEERTTIETPKKKLASKKAEGVYTIPLHRAGHLSMNNDGTEETKSEPEMDPDSTLDQASSDKDVVTHTCPTAKVLTEEENPVDFEPMVQDFDAEHPLYLFFINQDVNEEVGQYLQDLEQRMPPSILKTSVYVLSSDKPSVLAKMKSELNLSFGFLSDGHRSLINVLESESTLPLGLFLFYKDYHILLCEERTSFDNLVDAAMFSASKSI